MKRGLMKLRSESQFENYIGIALVVFGILMRLGPHPGNFAPVTAIALFSGVVLAPQIALFLPLTIMIASDLILGPHALYPLTWGSFFLISLLGVFIRRDVKLSKIAYGSLGASTVFYLITNLGVFIFQNMYEKSWQGLGQCYLMALPFFRNSLLGDLFYTAILFGVFAAIKVFSTRASSQRT